MSPILALLLALVAQSGRDAVTVAVGIIAILTAFVALLRWLRPKWRNFMRQVTGVRDAILGRDAIIDSITYEEKVPALPGLGVRMAATEANVQTIADAVATLAEAQKNQKHLEERVDDHDRRIRALEDARLEQVVTRAESANAWRAVAAAHEAGRAEELEQPDLDDDTMDDAGDDDSGRPPA